MDKKPVKKGLHKFVATGGNPKDYKGAIPGAVVKPVKK